MYYSINLFYQAKRLYNEEEEEGCFQDIHNKNNLSCNSPSNRKPQNTPLISRSASSNFEAYIQTIAEIKSQIRSSLFSPFYILLLFEIFRKYDPYPCILGIPVMPALFTTCKFYIFISFVLIGTRTMVSCLRQI
jgi:hypothetical protein